MSKAPVGGRTICHHLLLVWGLWLALPFPAFAWGPAAHEAVATLAAERLTPATAKEVAALLGRESLVQVSVWADEVRNTTHTHTTGWHFTNIPITSSGYRASRDCPQGSCVVAAIQRQEAILRDRTRPAAARAEALKFLVHLIGDIHQPLHAADAGDRGGNNREIEMVGGSRNLHAAWDSGIIQSRGSSTRALVTAANQWLQTQTESTVAGGSAEDWANESYRLARDITYAQVRGDNAITGPERVEALRIIEKRIARAGVRLAAVLNRAMALATGTR
jgi:hypothetical protein